MKKIILIVCFILCCCCSAFADVYDYPQNLEYISAALPKLSSIKCAFKQEKYLNNIQKPIVSGGDFVFKKDEGVYFYTKYPIQSKVDYTNKNYKQINDIINAISSKKYSKIEKEFKFYYQKKSNSWTMGMKPQKASRTADYISYISISGEDYINKIEIVQTNGNKTIIWLKK